MILFTGTAVDPDWTPCESCNCQEGVSPFPKWGLAGVLEPTARCPRYNASADSRGWLELYSHYKDGHLLKSGGVEDQPAIYLEAMRAIQYAIGVFSG